MELGETRGAVSGTALSAAALLPELGSKPCPLKAKPCVTWVRRWKQMQLLVLHLANAFLFKINVMRQVQHPSVLGFDCDMEARNQAKRRFGCKAAPALLALPGPSAMLLQKWPEGCCCVYVKEKKQRQTCISTELAKLLGCFITSMGSSSVTALVTFLEFNVAVKECGLALKMWYILWAWHFSSRNIFKVRFSSSKLVENAVYYSCDYTTARQCLSLRGEEVECLHLLFSLIGNEGRTILSHLLHIYTCQFKGDGIMLNQIL